MLTYKYCKKKILINIATVMENILYWWAFLYYQPCKFEADIIKYTQLNHTEPISTGVCLLSIQTVTITQDLLNEDFKHSVA